MFAHEFVRNAWLAGTFVALACGLIGWFTVMRAQVFAGDALSHVAFVGAIAAATIGIDERIGLFALTLLLAGAMGTLGRRAEADDVSIGTTFAWILGIGVLLLAVLATSAGGASGVTTANTLFGSIYSLSPGTAIVAAVVGLALAVLIVAIARPMLMSTIDPELATQRGIPVRTLGLVFLAALAIVTAQATQAVGALLLLGLIAAPAGAAGQLTARPYLGLALSGAIAVASVWIGLGVSYSVSALPPSTAIIGTAALAYLASAGQKAWRRAEWRWPRGPAGMLGRESQPEPPPVPQGADTVVRGRRGAHSSSSAGSTKR
jgi:zinc/manganese transport system permease protein